MNLAINWTVDSQIIDGWNTPNLYGLLFVSGLIIGFFVIKRMFKSEQIPEAQLDKLLLYMIIATVVGARLGHCLFYGPYWDVVSPEGIILEEGYLSNPLNMLKIWEGGLASHGGAIAILIALYLYSKKVSKKPMIWILDRVVAPIAIASCAIRLGNLVNHEIVGIPWDGPFAFIFNNESTSLMVDTPEGFKHVPRHPAQLYEAICYFISFLVLLFMYWKTNLKEKAGVMFGTFLILIFTARFFVEFVKVGQAARDESLIINTGQWLSVPFVLAGFAIIMWALKKGDKSNVQSA